MRLVIARRAIAAATLATVLVTSCGDDDDPANEAQPNRDGSEEFCAAFGPLSEEGDAMFADGTPSSADLQDLLGRMGALEPPAEIADDFALVSEAFELLSDSLAGDPQARAELDERSAEFDAADERLEPFMRDVCGLDYGD